MLQSFAYHHGACPQRCPVVSGCQRPPTHTGGSGGMATARVLPPEENRMFAGFLLVMLGLVSLWSARFWTRLRRQVTAWPVVRGRVTARHTIQPTDRGRTSPPAFRWAPDVRFTYRVGDTDYVGEKSGCPGAGHIPRPRPRPSWPPSPTRSMSATIPRIPRRAACIRPPTGTSSGTASPAWCCSASAGSSCWCRPSGGRPSRAARSGAGARTVHTCASGRVA